MAKTTLPKLTEHFLRDFSLEISRPPLVNPQKGEQELQFTVSMHYAPGKNAGDFEVLLASRLVIWHAPTRQPLVVTDHAYSGLFHGEKVPQNPLLGPDLAEKLYPMARDSFMQHLALVGHKPPLPNSVDFKENINKP